MYNDLRDVIRAAPFEPFRIHLNDGRHFDIHHPEFIGLFFDSVHVAVPTDSERPEYLTRIQISNITSIDKLPQKQKQQQA